MTTANKATEFLGREFVITREFNAPRELVWKACTEANHLAQWWGPKGFSAPVCEWNAEPGNKIFVIMRGPDGTDYPMGGEFREVLPPEKLVTITGALDEKGEFLFQFLHTMTLVERSGKTKLAMHSRVIHTTPGAERYIGGFEMGMTMSLERLGEHLDEKTDPFVIERLLDAPVATVWRAITTNEGMKRWFFEMEGFKPEEGNEFHFTVEHKGTTFRHLCKIAEVIPQKRLAYSWRYDGYQGDSLVSFDLVAEGNKTKVKLTHTGLENFPQKPEFARQNFMQGWTQLLGTELKDYAENTDRELYVSRDFNAPRELVWEAMTNPKHVVNWWGPRGFKSTIEQMDFRPGGIWKHVMEGPDGTKYPNESVFMEIVKHEKIVYSHGGHRENGPSIRFISTWTFESLGPNKTRVSMRGIFPTATERDFVVKEFNAQEGGRQTLERMGEHIATMVTEPFVISHTFNAPRELVWKAWTDCSHLMKWFGPKGCTISAAKLDLQPGGVFHYCMKMPDGKEMWGKWTFREIVPPKKLVLINSFSDSDGGITRHPLSPTWPRETLSSTTFKELDGKTKLTIQWVPFNATEEEIKTFDSARGGMTQGWTGTFEQLEQYLRTI